MFESFLGVNPWTALFTLINTLTIFFVAKKYLFGPVMRIIDDRQREIEGMYEDAGLAKSEAEALSDQYRQQLSDAQTTADRIIKDAVARGQARQEEILRNAKADAAAIMDGAAADIAQEKKKAINDAKNELSDVAISIAEKVVERQINAQDEQALINRFIDNLGDAL